MKLVFSWFAPLVRILEIFWIIRASSPTTTTKWQTTVGWDTVTWLCFVLQVKPLLQVTNTEEKLNKKETELRQVAEHLTHLREEHDSLKTEHQQLISDKVLLTEQLQAEQDLCAETEEVLYLFFC